MSSVGFWTKVAVQVLLSITIVQAVYPSSFVRSPTGAKIPLKVLAAILPDVPVYELHKYLHQLSTDLKLQSHSSTVDLAGVLGQPETIHRGTTAVYVNGKLSQQALKGYIRRGHGYSVTTTENGSVVSVKVPGVVLQPVNQSSYPNLFVDVHAKGRPLSFGNDELSVPGIQDSATGSRDPVLVENAEPSCLGAAAPPQYVELAIAGDSALCTKYGSSVATEIAILSMVSEAENIYKQHVCIRFDVTVLDIQCDPATDPYAAIVDPLPDFRAIWETQAVSELHRDAVVLVTGVNYLSSVIGQAYVGQTCSPNYSFMWVELVNELVFAHEIGHNMDAGHTTEGLMTSALSTSDSYLSQVSIDEIVAFVDAETSKSICIEAASPSPTPSTSPSKSPPHSPSPSPVPPGPITCHSNLLHLQSMKCTSPGASYTVTIPVTIDGKSGELTLFTTIEQRYGFGFGVSAPSYILVGPKKSRLRLTVTVENVQVLAGFVAATEAEVASQNSQVLGDGSVVTGFYYPGPLDPPTETSSCCGETMKVSALTTLRLTGSGVDTQLSEFVVRDATVQCVQFFSCYTEFSAMSDSVECPVCRG